MVLLQFQIPEKRNKKKLSLKSRGKKIVRLISKQRQYGFIQEAFIMVMYQHISFYEANNTAHLHYKQSQILVMLYYVQKKNETKRILKKRVHKNNLTIFQNC